MMRVTKRTFCAMVVGLFAALMVAPSARAAQVSGIRVNQESVFLIPAPVVQKVEVMLVENFVRTPEGSPNVSIPVPQDATKVTVSGASSSTWHRQGTAVLFPELLKKKQAVQISVSFTVPFSSATGRQLDLVSNYPIDVAHLYVPIGSASLSASGLQVATQTVNISGTTFRVFTRGGIPVGSWDLSLNLLPGLSTGPSTGGLPVLAGIDHQQGDTRQALANLAIAAFVFILGVLGIRSKGIGKAGRNRREIREDALYQAWNALEDAYAKGQVTTEHYEQRRDAYLNQLLSLKKQGVARKETS